MAITLTLAATSTFTISDLPQVIDFISTEADITSFTTTRLAGSGFFDGVFHDFTALGSGFVASVISGETFVTSGVLSSIDFNAPTESIAFTNLNIDLAVFTPIIIADMNGSALLGIENFLLGKAWDLTLGNLDDIAPKGTLIGDGAAFNLIGNDILRGQGGNDNLYSGDGSDKLFGGVGKDVLDGGAGNDVVKGGKGNDKLFGSAGRDKLFGEGGRDVLKGGGQKDVLDGGKGNDVLIGGAGFDKFVFKNGSGRDKVKDFNANSNKEDIVLKAVSEITGFADLKSNHMNQVDANVVIDDGAGTKIVLVNVALGDLGEGDFLF